MGRKQTNKVNNQPDLWRHEISDQVLDKKLVRFRLKQGLLVLDFEDEDGEWTVLHVTHCYGKLAMRVFKDGDMITEE